MVLNKNNNLSYWELKHYFSGYDLIVIGAGIVGLNAAISFKQLQKKARVLVVEKGVFPEGASTKNAGFACFGSPGELLDDLSHTPEKTVLETISLRWRGLQLLRKRLGDKNIDYKGYGGFELFRESEPFEICLHNLGYLNNLVQEATMQKASYRVSKKYSGSFKGVKGILHNRYEGQIDTGNMMVCLERRALDLGIKVLYGCPILELSDKGSSVQLNSTLGTFDAKKVIVATNGFAGQLIKLKDVKPARAQVLITSPIKNLNIQGSFHFDRGYYYFRNIDNRILFGGGRHLDFAVEKTTDPSLNPRIQNKLSSLLKTLILPHTPFFIEYRWTGIMGVGKEKKPIIKKISTNCVVAVRMGGMGVAIGSLVGDQAAKLIAE